MSDRFVPAVRTAALPIAVWALHFVLLYAGSAFGCRIGADAGVVAGRPLLQWLLLAVTVPVAGWLGWVVVAGMAGSRAHRTAGGGERVVDGATVEGVHGEGPGTGPWLGRIASSGFALVAVCWETIPVLVLPLCGR